MWDGVEGHIRTWEKIYPFYLVIERDTRKESVIANTAINKVWEGKWLKIKSNFSHGSVWIAFVTNKSFWFQLYSQSGLSTGGVRGVALLEQDEAIFKDGRGGEVVFTLKDGFLVVSANELMSGYGGKGVSFSGTYSK